MNELKAMVTVSDYFSPNGDIYFLKSKKDVYDNNDGEYVTNMELITHKRADIYPVYEDMRRTDSINVVLTLTSDNIKFMIETAMKSSELIVNLVTINFCMGGIDPRRDPYDFVGFRPQLILMNNINLSDCIETGLVISFTTKLSKKAESDKDYVSYTQILDIR